MIHSEGMALYRLHYLLATFLLLIGGQAHASNHFSVSIDEEEITVQHFPADGDDLMLWIAPGYGEDERFLQIAPKLTEQSIEVWYVDLAESLFLTKNTATMRGLDGRYISGLIEHAHTSTQKRITLVSRSYGSIPLLRGARLWQLNERKKTQRTVTSILTGAILFSPEFYASIPPLGIDPEYVPIVHSSTIPLMIYQAGNRNNRWRLPLLLEALQSNGAMVYSKVLEDVTGLFYDKDMAEETQKAFNELPEELSVILSLLNRTLTPLNTKSLSLPAPSKSGYDIELKPYKAKPTPLPLDLKDTAGKRVQRSEYKGKVTLVNFWASWCGPCVEEIPSLNKLRTTMKGKPFELISVNYAESTETMQAFLKEVDVDFPVLMDRDGKVSLAWNVIVFPSTYVIGPDGNIVYGVNAAIHWDSPEVINVLNHLIE